MIASCNLLSIKICVHMIDDSNNEIRRGGVKREVGRNEKQLIKFAWPKELVYKTDPFNHPVANNNFAKPPHHKEQPAPGI